LENQKPTSKFGILPAPGQNIKPYTNEFLSLYSLQSKSNQVISIVSLPTIDANTLTSLANNPPIAILITRDNFTSSIDLQSKIDSIKTTLPTSEIIISQDSEGHNTIPWISTNARSFYKSPGEAMDATSRKSSALKSLGFTGAIVTTSQDSDEYLLPIVDSATSHLKPYVLYTGSLPTFTANLVIENDQDLEKIKTSGYQGDLYLVTQKEN
jgi:hypothetical protein